MTISPTIKESTNHGVYKISNGKFYHPQRRRLFLLGRQNRQPSFPLVVGVTRRCVAGIGRRDRVGAALKKMRVCVFLCLTGRPVADTIGAWLTHTHERRKHVKSNFSSRRNLRRFFYLQSQLHLVLQNYTPNREKRLDHPGAKRQVVRGRKHPSKHHQIF